MAIVRRRGSGCVVQPLRSQANVSRMITEMRRSLESQGVVSTLGYHGRIPISRAIPRRPCGAVNYVSQLQLKCLKQNRHGPKQYDPMPLVWVQVKPNECYLENVRFAPIRSHIEQAPQEGESARSES